jgi:uncharacterized protein (UPF0147 family)
MSRLKDESLTKCVSLLREFIDETSAQDNKKRAAVLALNHLQKITAGTDLQFPGTYTPMCVDTLRINGAPVN